MTLGVLYQKRVCAHLDLVTGNAVQLAFAGAACLAVAWWIDDHPVEWTLRVYAVLGWSVLVLSIAATLLLDLVPPVTALMAWAPSERRSWGAPSPASTSPRPGWPSLGPAPPRPAEEE